MSEFEKLQAVQGQSQPIGEFLDWLPTQGIALCRWSDTQKEWIPDAIPINERLATYFEIDLDILEQERQAALEAFIASQREPPTEGKGR